MFDRVVDAQVMHTVYVDRPIGREAPVHIVRDAESEWQVSANGTRFKLLNDPEQGEREHFEMTIRHYEGNAHRVRRHRHKIEQVRYVLKGDAGPNDGMSSPPGSVNYIGASTFYGPYNRSGDVEYLEVRFGGTEAPDRAFPPARFGSPVVLYPEAFREARVDCTVEVSLVGSCDQNPVVSTLQVEAREIHRLEFLRTTLLFVTNGSGTIDARAVGERDGVTLPPGTATFAAGDARFGVLIVRLPPPLDPVRARIIG
jgi:hypothetical protein